MIRTKLRGGGPLLGLSPYISERSNSCVIQGLHKIEKNVWGLKSDEAQEAMLALGGLTVQRKAG